MENRLISVVVPVYNTELYLRECIESILASTYKNLEIFLIDDGSSDNCGKICDEYIKRDSRIKVIHQKNQGLAFARNAGMKIACGEYVSFVDSDDTISPIMYENMLWAIELTNADLVACESTRKLEKLDVLGNVSKEQLEMVEGYDDCISVLTNKSSCRKFTWTNSMVTNKLTCCAI